jgi:spermidine synthase
VRTRGLVLALFFLSGATGLVYEVVWTRQLSLIFGVTVFAAATVLAAFMGGLALGSFAIGRWLDRHPNPLRVYALLEAGIGASALAMPFALRAIEPLYVAASRLVEDRFLLQNLVRSLLVAVPLLVPTTLMGGTVPAIARYLVERRESIGWNTGLLYAVNTFGAVLGCLLAGFAFVPRLGLTASSRAAVVLNLAIAALLLLGRFGEPDSHARAALAAPAARALSTPRDPHALLAVAVFALSGFAALGFELLWTRALVVHVHNTNYAFTVMLAIFLAGLAIGGALLMRIYDRIARPLLWLGVVELLVGLSSLLAAAAYGSLQRLSLGLLGLDAVSGWGQALSLICLRAGLVLLPSAILFGTTFPLVARVVCGDLRDLGRRLGGAYAANTGGAILGSLGTAFLLIPRLGLRGTLVCLSGLCILLGGACLFAVIRPMGPRLAVASAALLLAALPAALIPRTLFFDAFESKHWKLVYYHEGPTDTTGVYEHRTSRERFVTYGDQRGTAGTGVASFGRRRSHLAHLLHPHPTRSLQIGFGVGNSLAAAALHPEVEQLDCIELSSQVRDTASYFWTNDGVLENPKVRLVTDDGRNYLLRTRTKYDVIELDPPEIFTAEVVNLYTTDFYRLASDALEPDGLLLQWLPTAIMGERETRMLVRSVVETFPEASLWWQGPHTESRGMLTNMLLVMGSKAPLRVDAQALRRRMDHPALREDLLRVETPTPGALLALYVAGTEALRHWVEEVPPVTDDLTRVDFSTPMLPQAGYGFGILRVNEKLGSQTEPQLSHLLHMMTTLQRLREPVTPLLAPSLDGASVLGEVTEQRRLFDEAVERLRGLVARAQRPGG